MTIFETMKRLRRLPRHHRIAHLKSCIKQEKPRSVRWQELVAALRQEMVTQLRVENRAA